MKPKKPTKPLPDWIVVSANDPKVKEAIEKELSDRLQKVADKKEESK